MAGILEVSIEDYVCTRAERAGFVVRKLQWIGRKHAPDRLFAKDEKIFLVEFKKPGGKKTAQEKLRPGQAGEHKAFAKAGVTIHTVDSITAGLKLLGIPYGN